MVEVRFFGGLTIEEAAEVMGLSSATIKREVVWPGRGCTDKIAG